MLTFVSKSINLYVKVTQNVLKNGGRIIKTLERFCYVETGFSSDLVLETIETTQRHFRLSEYRCSQNKQWQQVNDTCC